MICPRCNKDIPVALFGSSIHNREDARKLINEIIVDLEYLHDGGFGCREEAYNILVKFKKLIREEVKK